MPKYDLDAVLAESIPRMPKGVRGIICKQAFTTPVELAIDIYKNKHNPEYRQDIINLINRGYYAAYDSPVLNNEINKLNPEFDANAYQNALISAPASEEFTADIEIALAAGNVI